MSELSALVSSVNAVWLTICAILIFFMQAGFAMLESGFIRSKNAVNVIMKNYIDMSLGSIGFFLIGFGLMFGTNPTGLVGMSHFLPSKLAPETYGFIFFQMMFAATAATIVSGALAERIRYWPYIAAAVLISTFIYPVFGSWVWGSLEPGSTGWLRRLGYIDFAGASVVHAVGGWCALAGILVLGPRSGRFGRKASHVIPGHNLPLAALGAFILWMGFFAFNAGSTLEASTRVGMIVLNTHLSGVAGVAGALIMLTLLRRRLLLAYPVNGGLGGLVAITAGANYVEPVFAVVTGFVAGAIVVLGMELLERLKLDDAVGAVPVHALGGTWGILSVGLFQAGDMFNPAQLAVQAMGVVTVFLWVFPVAWLMFTSLSGFMNLRVSVAEERRGLDYSEHYELGYPEFQDALLHQGREAVVQPSETGQFVFTDTSS